MNEVVLLDNYEIESVKTLDADERIMFAKAEDLLEKYPEHSLIELWNASIHNLRRRVEAYSIEMFEGAIQNLGGRIKYKPDGDTLSERWNGVDDENLLKGATQIGILSKKSAKVLESIEWMRNHASPAHDSDDCVKLVDVKAFGALLLENLFLVDMPNPAHSPARLIKLLKNETITSEQIALYKDEIENYNNNSIRTLFGVCIDILQKGEEPSYSNAQKLFQNVWNKATEELKQELGSKFNELMYSSDELDKEKRNRLYEVIISVKGVKYIPVPSRTIIYKKLAKELAKAKDTSYGWSAEYSASKSLNQVGPYVPTEVFVDVYQEILSCWCGNYWGRSGAYNELNDFIFNVSNTEKVKIAKLFKTNKRVQSELFYSKPKNYALNLLNELKKTLTLENQKSEIDDCINFVKKFDF